MLRSVTVSDRTPMRTADPSRPRRQTCSCEVSNIRPLRARGLLSPGTHTPPTIASPVGEAVKPRTLCGDERRVSVERHRRGCWAEGATRRPDFCHCHSRPPSGRWLARTHRRLSLAREGSTWRPRPSQCQDSSQAATSSPTTAGRARPGGAGAVSLPLRRGPGRRPVPRAGLPPCCRAYSSPLAACWSRERVRASAHPTKG